MKTKTNCKAGKPVSIYDLPKEPVCCFGDKTAENPACEHLETCIYDLGYEFGKYAAARGVKPSKNEAKKYCRFKTMSEGK